MSDGQYQQSTGMLTKAGVLVATGFSGNDSRPGANPGHVHGFNNPAAQELHKIGPLPQGTWKVGEWGNHPDLGPVVAPLALVAGDAFGRTGFFIHGPSAADRLNSSEGCLVFDHWPRLAVKAAFPAGSTIDCVA